MNTVWIIIAILLGCISLYFCIKYYRLRRAFKDARQGSLLYDLVVRGTDLLCSTYEEYKKLPTPDWDIFAVQAVNVMLREQDQKISDEYLAYQRARYGNFLKKISEPYLKERIRLLIKEKMCPELIRGILGDVEQST